MIGEIVLETFGAAIAVVFGVIAFRKLDGFHKLLLAQLFIWLILYVLSYLVVEFQKSRHLMLNNHWVFNLNILLETSFLSLALFDYFKGRSMRWILALALGFYLIIFFTSISLNGFFTFNEVSFNTECFIMILLYGGLLLKAVYISVQQSRLQPHMLVGLGMVLYFAGNLPYFSLFNYLNSNNVEVSETLHRNITDVLSNIRYLTLAAAFIIFIVSPKQDY